MEQVGQVLERALKKRDVERKMLLFELKRHWQELFGDGGAGSEPLFFKGAKLYVRAPHSCQAFEIELGKERVKSFLRDRGWNGKLEIRVEISDGKKGDSLSG